jgi:hypothetical protein
VTYFNFFLDKGLFLLQSGIKWYKVG